MILGMQHPVRQVRIKFRLEDYREHRHRKSDRYRDLYEGGNLVPWINLPFQPQKPLQVHSDDSLQKEIKRAG